MPLTEVNEAREAAADARRRRFAQFITAAVVFMVAAVGLVIWMVGNVGAKADRMSHQVIEIKGTQHQIQATQRDAAIRGLKNRAVACRAVEQTGGRFGEGDPCKDAELAPYFTPSGVGQ